MVGVTGSIPVAPTIPRVAENQGFLGHQQLAPYLLHDRLARE